MVRSSFGEGVLPCVLFYLFPLKFSISAHRLATGRDFFRREGVARPGHPEYDEGQPFWDS